MDSNHILQVHLYNSKPVEVTDLADMMVALSNEYSSFCKKRGAAGESKLYVSEVRKGSVIVDLIAISSAVALIENFNSIVEFGGHIKSAYEYLRGITSDRPSDVDVETFRNFKKIVEPSCKDANSRITISVVDSPNSLINVMMDGVSHDASVVKNASDAKDDMENLPSILKEPKVVLYLSQLRNSGDSVGDRGIVENFSKSPKKLISVDDSFKRAVLDSSDNAFNYGYVVDVEVSKIGDRIVAYRIMKYHEKFALNEDELF